MNTEQMTPEQKSVMLAKLCGWVIEDIGFGQNVIIPPDETSLLTGVLNLYDPANMALAWRVLNWAMDQEEWSTRYKSFLSDEFFLRVMDANENGELFSLPPAEAQRLWLDKVLQLAIEAGMVERP